MTSLPQYLHEPRRDVMAGGIPVLFIAGAGRSGSTLVDRIVGSYKNFCSAGELRFIWERSYGDNQLCGCGVPFDDCAFWAQVSRAAFGMETERVDATPAIRLRESLDEARYALWLIQSRSPAYYRSALLVYGRILERLYEKIVQVSHDRVIVDSSGDATHGLILSRTPGIELHVVHLIRDSRAVAFSWKRTRLRPEIHWAPEGMPIENVRTSAIRWMLNNTMAEMLAKTAVSYCRLRYEEFVSNPGASLSRILAPYDWASGRTLTGVTGDEVVLKPSHTVSGNPMRFKQGAVKLKLDDEWQRSMAWRDRRLVEAITWPLLARYGYPVRSIA